MSIGKYLTNMGVLGALIGVLGTSKQTQAMPKDWRRLIVWGVWVAGLVLAIAGVAKQSEDEEHEQQVLLAQKQAKADAKAARRAR